MARDPYPLDLKQRICPVFYPGWEPSALESDVGSDIHTSSSWAFSFGWAGGGGVLDAEDTSTFLLWSMSPVLGRPPEGASLESSIIRRRCWGWARR